MHQNCAKMRFPSHVLQIKDLGPSNDGKKKKRQSGIGVPAHEAQYYLTHTVSQKLCFVKEKRISK
jgi:hypothetical protein